MVVVDFDETCTKEDAVGPLFDVCLESALKVSQWPQPQDWFGFRTSAANRTSRFVVGTHFALKWFLLKTDVYEIDVHGVDFCNLLQYV